MPENEPSLNGPAKTNAQDRVVSAPPTDSGFRLQELLDQWMGRLQKASPETLVSEIQAFARSVADSRPESREDTEKYMQVAHLLGRLEAHARNQLGPAKAPEYQIDEAGKTAARTRPSAPTDIAAKIDRLGKDVDRLRSSSSNLTDGIPITVGPIGISLTALAEAIRTSKMIASGAIKYDTDKLKQSLTRAAEFAGTTLRQATDRPHLISPGVMQLIRDVARQSVSLITEGSDTPEEVAQSVGRDNGAGPQTVRSRSPQSPTVLPANLALSNDMAIELGTAFTKIYMKGLGIVLLEPSVVATISQQQLKQAYVVGNDAKIMVGRTPRNIESVRPILNGLISDPETADEMIGQFIRKVYARRTFGKPMVVLAVPSGLTNIQQHAMAASVQLACDGRMYLIEKPMAAAIGAGLPVFEAQTSMVVDIGGGTTELGIISNGRIKFSRSVHVGGDKVDEAIVGYLRSQRHLLVGEASAETMKREIGCAGPYFDGDGRTYELKGQHLLKRLPATISVTQREIVAAIAEPMRAIANAIRETVETAPSELTSRISISTITLTGGGAELAGIDRFLCEETGFAFVIAENPSTCVVVGAGRAMEDQKNELRLNPIDS